MAISRKKPQNNSKKTTSFSKKSSKDNPNNDKKSYKKPFPKNGKTKEKALKPLSAETRLNKFIANAGICSRREADTLIATGLASVNGKVITEMGYKVQKTDVVKFDGRTLKAEKPVYVLLNKPKGFVALTTTKSANKSVLDLTQNASPYKLTPVDKMDRVTIGVILLTNDHEMIKKLNHSSTKYTHIYQVELDKPFSPSDLEEVQNNGIRIEEGLLQVKSISYIPNTPKTTVGIELEQNFPKLVFRIFKKLGYKVEILDRVSYAGLNKKNVPRGSWRILTPLEVSNLKML